MLDLPDKDFKSAILNRLKELKETMSNKLKESMAVMSLLLETIKKSQIRILKLKTTKTEKKNLPQEQSHI